MRSVPKLNGPLIPLGSSLTLAKSAHFTEKTTMQNRRQFLAQSVATTLATSVIGGTGISVAQDSSEWAYKLFEKRSHDFGTVARGAETVYRLKMKNIFEQEVHIAEIRKNCGCTNAKPEKETLKSLEETYIAIEMNTVKFENLKTSSIVVVIDRPQFAEVTIPIQAYIRRDVVLQPGAAQFGSVYRDDKNDKVLKLQYAGRDDWRIKDIKTNHEHITAKVVETNRGSGRVDYDVIVELSQSAPIGSLRQYMTIVTDDEKSPHVPVLVEADIRADISVDPAVVSLGTMNPGQSKTVQVVLKGRKPFSVESVTCEKVKDVFQVRLPKNPGPVQIIPLTVTAPETPGTLDEELSVGIPGRAEPVKFRAYAKIVARE